MAKKVNNAAVDHTEMLDRKMGGIFDWAKDNLAEKPVRVAIWNHEMEKNGQDTMKTAEDVAWELSATDDEIKDWCNNNLK